MLRKAYQTEASTLKDKRQVRVVISTPEVDRAGETVVQDGISFEDYRLNPVILWNHDPEQPIARAVFIGLEMGKTVALAQFPEAGISAKADEVYGLIDQGVINAASIGFNPTDMEPVDPREPKGPQIYNKCELLEFSFVSIPAVRSATIIERSAEGKIKMPEVKKDVIAIKARIAGSLMTKGLYDVGRLAGMLEELGWTREGAAYEAEREGDGSKVPAMIGDALKVLADAFMAMAQEEVAELLAQHVPAEPLNPLPTVSDPAAGSARPEDLVAVATSTSPAVRLFHAARVKTKASLRVQGKNIKPRERTDEEKAKAVARAKERLVAAGLA